MTGRAHADLVESLDYVWGRVRGRVDDLGDDEYLWEPVAGCWTVRPSAPPTVDRVFPDPEPAPVTTIAWRAWHIAVECVDGYSERGFGAKALDLGEQEWVLSAAEARDALDRAWAGFREGCVALGEEGLWRTLGPTFGPFADSTYAALLLHCQDEISHHGAEISLLRDLYAARF